MKFKVKYPDVPVSVWKNSFLKSKKVKWVLLGTGTLVTAGMLFLLVCNLIVLSHAGKIYHSAEKVPAFNVGLVLGTRPEAGGRPNLYFTSRIDAAATLYRKGKIRKIIVSGDNGRKEYDEVTAMRNALIERGIPEKDIYPDYAGFRTLDSMIRAKKIFQVRKLIVISQEFHCTRALFIAAGHDIGAIGFAATDPGNKYPAYRLKMGCREILARTAAVVDVFILGRKPRFLGETIEIEG